MAMAFAASGLGLTMNGGSPLIPLGIELVIPNNPPMVTAYYNLFAVFILMILATTASMRDAKFVSLLMPFWAGFSMFAGWLTFPDMGAGFGIVVVCTLLAGMTYMQDTVHERFGIAGPGNKMVKIFTFIVILQCVVVFMNSPAIFPSIFPSAQPVAVSNTQFVTIDLSAQMGSNGIAGAGGLFAKIVDIASITLQMAVSALLIVVKCIVAVALFAVVMYQVFPWVGAAGAGGLAFLVVIQFAIWIVYLMFVFSVYYKPGPDPGW